MKTYDGAELALRYYNSRIGNYPAKSVSRREVVYTIPVGDEQMYDKLNSALTKTMQADATAVVSKNNNQPLRVVPKEELERVTNLARQVAVNIEKSATPAK
jgi:hypothetical protein